MLWVQTHNVTKTGCLFHLAAPAHISVKPINIDVLIHTGLTCNNEAKTAVLQWTTFLYFRLFYENYLSTLKILELYREW